MPATGDVVEAVEAIAAPLADVLGLEIADIQYRREGGRWFLRVFIDKPEGAVSLGECEALSGPLGRALDQKDLIPHDYFLEVSSPGLERVLKKPAHFRRFIGRDASIVTTERLQGRRKFSGKIVSAEEDKVRLAVDGVTVEIPYTAISKANLVFKWS